MDLLDQTLEAHYQSGIKLKAKKTLLFEDAVDYLGFKVDQDGIKITYKYVQQIKTCLNSNLAKIWPLHTAQGFFGYYREFLPKIPVLTPEMNEVKPNAAGNQTLGPQNYKMECIPNIVGKCGTHERCAQCLVLLNAQKKWNPTPSNQPLMMHWPKIPQL